MKELILVRHGEAEHLTKGIIGGWTDLPLTDRGRRQVVLTAKRLKDLFGTRIEGMYASDLKRAKESAKLILEEFDIPLIIDPQFRELNLGISKDMIQEEAKKIEVPPSKPLLDWMPYPEGESWRMLQQRVSTAMSDLQQKPEEVVLIVSHGNIMSAIIDWWLQLPEDFLLHFASHTACITWLGISGWGQREIIKMNETAHLSGAGLDDSH